MKIGKNARAWVLLVLALTALAAASIASAHGISPEARQRMIDGGNWEYFVLGAEHMVTGYDHLLFLFGVVFFLSRFFDILKYVTSLTDVPIDPEWDSLRDVGVNEDTTVSYSLATKLPARLVLDRVRPDPSPRRRG